MWWPISMMRLTILQDVLSIGLMFFRRKRAVTIEIKLHSSLLSAQPSLFMFLLCELSCILTFRFIQYAVAIQVEHFHGTSFDFFG